MIFYTLLSVAFDKEYIMLTKKAKEDFTNWLTSNEDIQDVKNRDINMHHWLSFKGFENLPLSMQFGVFQDFFDDKGFDITIDVDEFIIFSNNTMTFRGTKNVIEGIIYEKLEGIKNKKQARRESILKMNEIYNERNQ